MLARLRKQGKSLLNVDAGDMLYPRLRTPYDPLAMHKARAAFMIQTQAGLGLQVWCPSALDMRHGLDGLMLMAAESGIALVASNLRREGPGALPPTHLIRRVGGLRVGLLGLVGERPGMPAWLGVGDPVQTAREGLRALADKADLIVVLSNLGLERDQELAAQVAGLHVIIGAGDDRMILVPRRAGDSLILQPYKQGEYLGLLRLYLRQPVLPMLDELDRFRLERTLSKLEDPDGSQGVALKKRLAAFDDTSTFRAVLRPLSEDIDDHTPTADAVRKQIEKEQTKP
jgi:5'-nucleotidase/UDP-sugar diphosphatase